MASYDDDRFRQKVASPQAKGIRFVAMLDDGVGFNLAPWRRVMGEQLGRLLRGVAVGANISGDFFQSAGDGPVIRQRSRCRRIRARVRPEILGELTARRPPRFTQLRRRF
jgi:hypothetical protein